MITSVLLEGVNGLHPRVKLVVMGHKFVEVRPVDKVVALVEGADAHKWTTVWPESDAPVKSVSREVSPLGSPKFYKLTDLEINKKHFFEDPAYFVSAILVEQALLAVPTAPKQDQPHQRATKTKVELKKDVERLTGLEQNVINEHWKDVDNHFTKNGSTVYSVKSPETFVFRVEEPWRAQFSGKGAPSKPKKSAKPNAEKSWLSNLTELTFASNGQIMGKEYEIHAKNVWGFLDSIDETKLTVKELKALGEQGSEATKRIVGLLKALANNSVPQISETLWEHVYSLPEKAYRQHSKLVQLLTNYKVKPKSLKQLVAFTIELIKKDDALFTSPVKALAEFASELTLTDKALLATLKDDELEILFMACDWKLPNKCRVLGAVVKRTPHFINGRDIFVGLERQTLFTLEGSELFDVLNRRGQLGKLIEPYIKNFVRLASDPAELFGLLKVASGIPGSIKKDDLKIATTKAFDSEGLFSEVWGELSGQARRKALEEDLTTAQSKLLEFERSLSKANSDYAASKKYAETLNRQLSSAIDSSHRDLGASNDAARLDAARAVASLAASLNDLLVEGKAEIMAIVKPTLSRLGIQATGEPGQDLRFNPEFHMDPSGHLKSGDMGVLITPGYTTSIGSETAVLRKAIVSER